MADYIWGLATLPIALAVLFVAAAILKGGYLLLGLLGKFGIAKFGKSGSDYRFRAGAVIASSDRVILINKGTTGVMFFTGIAHKSLHFGAVGIYDSALQKADRTIREDYLPTAESTQDPA